MSEEQNAIAMQKQIIIGLKAEKDSKAHEHAGAKMMYETAYKARDKEGQENYEAKMEKAKKELDDITTQIALAETALKDLQGAVKEENKQTDFDRLAKMVPKRNMVYLAEDDVFLTCTDTSGDPDVCKPVLKKFKARNIVRILNNYLPKSQLLKIDPEDVKDFFQTADLKDKEGKDLCISYVGQMSTLNEATYHNAEWYNPVKVVRDNYWLKPDLEADFYSSYFDFWLKCIGGGKKENQDQLTKWILFKYLYPEKVANMPNLDIASNPGGTGKGALVSLLRTIFTDMCVAQAPLSSLERFNAGWENKVVIVFDEMKHDNKAADQEKLKNITGDDKITIEPKGVDAYQSERMYSVVITHQGPNSAVRLNGSGEGGEDRRWDFFYSTNDMFGEAIKHLMTLSEWAGVPETDEVLRRTAKRYVNQVYKTLQSRKEVAKWLKFKIEEFVVELEGGELTCLHGEDYKRVTQTGHSPFESAMRALVEHVRNTDGISLRLAHQIIKVLVPGEAKTSPNHFSGQFESYLNSAKVPFVAKTQVRVTEVFGKDANNIPAKNKPQTTYFAVGGSTTYCDDYERILSTKPGTSGSDSWVKQVQTGDSLVEELRSWGL